MNRRILACLILFLLAALPVAADVSIRDITFRRTGAESLNVRIFLKNRAKTVQDGPIKVTLFVRNGSSEEWQQVQTWTDIESIQAGGDVSRDALADSSDLLKNTASNVDFQAKVVVEAPGSEPVTKIVSNNRPQKF